MTTDDDRFRFVDAGAAGDDADVPAGDKADAAPPDDLDAARVRRASANRRAMHRQRAMLSVASLVLAVLAVQMAASFVADARSRGLTARPLLSAGVCAASTAAAWVFFRRAAGVAREIAASAARDAADPDFTGLGSVTTDERFDAMR